MKKLALTIIAIALLLTVANGNSIPEKIIKLRDRNAITEKTFADGENITVLHHNAKGIYKTTLSPKIETTLLHSFEKPKK